ncbi:stage II sporulation protein M [Actinomadura livida]|uniref:Putative membrane protein SpoIIM required for sporulation n=1 Tax=Actinomadura livida TaxID=79909 RepID=A0A7W7MVX2_9ACTN|nr:MULTISPECIES: stage II sporulation protein M [Actinomadura]MBB4773018.1 putative membrane protein SpoIIM required for sporulation [Actinomadura catellatispora]GGU17499.1 membrane protein [Actinomadura livida]
MDVDAYVAAHNAEWQRLEWLINRGRRLTGAEADELVELYQRAATHLSVVRSSSPDPQLVGRLSSLVARGRAAVAGAQAPLWRDVTRFAKVSFPVVAYRARWWWLGCAVLGNLVSLALAIWIVHSPEVQASLGTPDEIRELVEHDFANYYTEHSASSFAFQVWVNNAWVSAVALIFGILLGIPTVYVLLLNQINLGLIGGLMFAYGKGDVFFGLILPHGLLELTAVYLACAGGLKLGWTIIDPGPRRRGQALAEEGRAAVSIAIGLVAVLLVSGLIEGFVTGWVHVTWLRIAIGVVAEVAFLAYVIVFGRRAVREGETGDADLRPDMAPVAG